ncbi:hypothetical protein [Variovorax sp. E3]|uniref:hypothetical protein n=1 Tax=Variovorax sp. E3 TaxID=1914993 RepID=UPI0018DDB857|nr:hypothetical protein [Variovorax sp. E3]
MAKITEIFNSNREIELSDSERLRIDMESRYAAYGLKLTTVFCEYDIDKFKVEFSLTNLKFSSVIFPESGTYSDIPGKLERVILSAFEVFFREKFFKIKPLSTVRKSTKTTTGEYYEITRRKNLRNFKVRENSIICTARRLESQESQWLITALSLQKKRIVFLPS